LFKKRTKPTDNVTELEFGCFTWFLVDTNANHWSMANYSRAITKSVLFFFD